MEETKRKKLDELVGKLGMSQSLAVLLDSDEYYERFERAVENCLQEYLEGKKGRSINTVYWKSKLGGKVILRPTLVPSKYFDVFRRNYGIGCSNQTLREIGTSEGVSLGCIGQKVRSVVEILRQKNKRDIWYGTL